MSDQIQRSKISVKEAIVVVAIMASIALVLYPSFQKMRHASGVKAVLGNLRIISSSAQQYMGMKNVTRVTYAELVGTGTDNYVRGISSVAGEDYSELVIVATQTQVSVSNAKFGTVTFNL